MITDFVRFTKIYPNCSEIQFQNLQNLCFEFQNNLCKPLKSEKNSSYILRQKHVYLTKNNLYRRTSKFEICSLIDGLHLSKLGLTKSHILLQSLSSPPSLNSTVFWIGVCLCLFAPIYPVQMGEQDIVSSHGLVQWNATETAVRMRKEFSHNDALCCKSICSLACFYYKVPMFGRAGMREGGEPLLLAFQYLIFMI